MATPKKYSNNTDNVTVVAGTVTVPGVSTAAKQDEAFDQLLSIKTSTYSSDNRLGLILDSTNGILDGIGAADPTNVNQKLTLINTNLGNVSTAANQVIGNTNLNGIEVNTASIALTTSDIYNLVVSLVLRPKASNLTSIYLAGYLTLALMTTAEQAYFAGNPDVFLVSRTVVYDGTTWNVSLVVSTM